MNRMRGSCAVLIGAILAGNASFAETKGLVWQKYSHGIHEKDLRWITASPAEPSLIFAGTDKGLYRSVDQGQNFQKVFSEFGVNHIYIPQNSPDQIYAATDQGLYQSIDQGQKWQRIFYSSDEKSRRCLAVLIANNTIYLGTQKGLFYKSIDGSSWKQLSGGFSSEPVYFIAQGADYLYFATRQRLYELDKRTQQLKEIFSYGSLSNNDDQDENINEEDIMTSQLIRSLDVQPVGGIVLATTQGIYFSFDQGKNWEMLPSSQIPLKDLTSLLIFPTDEPNQENRQGALNNFKLLAGTRKGAYYFHNGTWTQIYKGLETNSIAFLTMKDGKVYAGTDRGVFYLDVRQALSDGIFEVNENYSHDDDDWSGEIDEAFNHEPTIEKVQRWAVDYAHADPGQIKDWHARAQKKAWLPKFSLGADGGSGRTISDSIYGTSSGGGFAYIGPNDKSYSYDVGWDASLSWDLSELIWNSDHTSIDSRSKSMTELRESILDQVTRVYFERRRIQMDLLTNKGQDPSVIIDKQMRVDELTALINGFTGGFFSRKMRNSD